MPYSHDAPKGWALTRIEQLAWAHTAGRLDILDVGPGAGTWGGCDYVTVAESDQPVGQGIPKWTWDLVILGDVLEHMTQPEALAVVDQALAHADAVLVVVPLGEWPQGPEEGNPLEAHVSTWDESDVLALPKLRRTTHYETADGWIAAALLGVWP
jgi:hypothetical protein